RGLVADIPAALSVTLARSATHRRSRTWGAETSPAPHAPEGDSALIEERHERVRARKETRRVRVPEPNVHRDEQRVPEAELRTRRRSRRAAGLRGGRDVRTVRVVAAGAERAVSGAGQRRRRGLRRPHPLERAELPRRAVVLVYE